MVELQPALLTDSSFSQFDYLSQYPSSLLLTSQARPTIVIIFVLKEEYYYDFVNGNYFCDLTFDYVRVFDVVLRM